MFFHCMIQALVVEDATKFVGGLTRRERILICDFEPLMLDRTFRYGRKARGLTVL